MAAIGVFCRQHSAGGGFGGSVRMSDAVFDGLSRFMRPVVNGEYASEMKTTLRDGMTQVEIEAAIRPPAPAMSDAWIW